MKAPFLILITTVALITVAFTSCKKTDTGTNNPDYTGELSVQSDDQSRFSTETDAVANDVNNIADNYPSLSGRPAGVTNLICDATVEIDSSSDPKTVTITYNGANCPGNRTRTGVVTLSIPQGVHWRDAGAAITVDIRQLKIIRLRDNTSITIDGTYLFTNISGGRLRDLSTIGTITHTITSSGVSVTFDNGSQRTWQVAKQRVFTYANGVVITTTGTHSDGGIAGISEWGTNRFGNAFVTAVTQPMVVKEDCGWRLVSGQVTHDRLVANVVVTFGLDAQGAVTTCPGTGNYYFKLEWTGAGGATRTVILPY